MYREIPMIRNYPQMSPGFPTITRDPTLVSSQPLPPRGTHPPLKMELQVPVTPPPGGDPPTPSGQPHVYKWSGGKEIGDTQQ